MTFRVDWDQDARDEVMRLPAAERRAVMNAVVKLEAFGDQLGWPHTSQVKGSRAGIRELRPLGQIAVAGPVPARRGGLVVLAIGPEAEHDKRGFGRAVRLAEERLKEIEGWRGG